MDESSLQLVSEIGNQLYRLTRTNKDALVKSLRQAAGALSQIEQPLSLEESKKEEALEKLETATKFLRKSIVKHRIHRHSDKDVKLLVAICITEVFRILAPEPPFEDKYLRDIFQLILSVFAELGDTSSPYFSKRVKILETVARCKCCIIMLDIDCNDLVLQLFNISFSVVRKDHQQSLVNDILSMLMHILIEEASQPLVDVILRNLLKDGKDAPSAASQLAVSLIQECAEKLKPFICAFLTACSLDRDSVENELKEFYHDILFKIFQCAPHILLAVIPNLIQELVTNQVDVRIKALNLIRRLFGCPEHRVAQKYPNLFLEFQNRFFDKAVEVRLSALQCAKACYMANPSGKESQEVLGSLEGRLLDFDDRVRMEALVVVCDLAKFNFQLFPSKLLVQVTERLRDKKMSVRIKALQKLLELYQEYCNKCTEGHMTISDNFEQIPCKVLMLCYDKDCKEFRPHNLELILTDNLFPASLPVNERMKHWIHISSLFTSVHEKALNIVLSQKRRLQTEMQIYLAAREEEHGTEEVEKKIKNSILKMSACFPDASKAEESFKGLNTMKDNKIFSSLKLLLNSHTFLDAQITRDKFLKIVGDNHPQFEFLSLLSSICSFNIFAIEHVSFILHHISSNGLESNKLEASARLLLAIINSFPSLLKGSDETFFMLLERDDMISNMLLEALPKAGPYISNNLSCFHPFLEKICFKGTRMQSKHAVSAIASFMNSSEQFIFSDLCKELVDSLNRGQNIPTVLQSLGCVAQHSVSAFETQYENVSSYIFEKIFQVAESDGGTVLNGSTECCHSCKLKIYGLKTLVKSLVPHRGSCSCGRIDKLLDCLLKMLRLGEVAEGTVSCTNGKMHIRLAAAKSVLRLSKKWDLHISPEIFCCTVLMAKDSSALVRKTFLQKMDKLWKKRALPGRFACAYALATADCFKDVQDVLLKCMEQFIKECSKRAHSHQTLGFQDGSSMDDPAYIFVFLLYVLAHDRSFPPANCKDEQAYAQLCSPLFGLVKTLTNVRMIDGQMDQINHAMLYLHNVFRAIKRAEDAVDPPGTSKLHILAEIGIGILKSFNNNVISSPRAPELILLPSSLYKAKLKCLPQSHFDESFVQRVIHILESQNSVLPSNLRKRGRKFQGDDLQSSDVQYHKLKVATPEDVDRCPMKITAKQETARQENSVLRCASSPLASELVGSQDQSSFLELHRTHSSGGSNPLLEKGQLPSSHDTRATTPQYEPKVSMPGVSTSTHSFKENAGTNSGFAAESSKSSRSKLKEPFSSRNTVLVEDLSSVEDIVDTFGSGAKVQEGCLTIKESGKNLNRMTSLPGKPMKVRKGTSGTSTSEVINEKENVVAKRTRRQKAIDGRQTVAS